MIQETNAYLPPQWPELDFWTKVKYHFMYLKYVILHKWYLFSMGIQLDLSLWRCIKHDWTKFLPSEWIPYVHNMPNFEYAKKQSSSGYFYRAGLNPEFDASVKLHKRRHKHHWDSEANFDSEGNPVAMDMEDAKEMIIDWIAAGRAQGKPDVRAWYNTNKDRLALHPSTRSYVEYVIFKILPYQPAFTGLLKGEK